MTDPTREDVSRAMQEATIEAETPAERNAQRRIAVEELLRGFPNHAGIQGTVHDMILSDLDSYPEWEPE